MNTHQLETMHGPLRYWQGEKITLEIPADQVSRVAIPGSDNEPAAVILADMLKDQFRDYSAEQLRAELQPYGAWDDSELQDDEQNRVRLAWLASWDLFEESDE